VGGSNISPDSLEGVIVSPEPAEPAEPDEKDEAMPPPEEQQKRPESESESATELSAVAIGLPSEHQPMLPFFGRCLS